MALKGRKAMIKNCIKKFKCGYIIVKNNIKFIKIVEKLHKNGKIQE